MASATQQSSPQAFFDFPGGSKRDFSGDGFDRERQQQQAPQTDRGGEKDHGADNRDRERPFDDNERQFGQPPPEQEPAGYIPREEDFNEFGQEFGHDHAGAFEDHGAGDNYRDHREQVGHEEDIFQHDEPEFRERDRDRDRLAQTSKEHFDVSERDRNHGMHPLEEELQHLVGEQQQQQTQAHHFRESPAGSFSHQQQRPTFEDLQQPSKSHQTDTSENVFARPPPLQQHVYKEENIASLPFSPQELPTETSPIRQFAQLENSQKARRESSPPQGYSKPMPIPHTRSYDSSLAHQAGHSNTSPSMTFSHSQQQQQQQQQQQSSSHRNDNGFPPTTGILGTSYGSNSQHAPQSTFTEPPPVPTANTSVFPEQPHSPAAAPNQTPAFPDLAQPYQPPSGSILGRHQPLYINHRQAQPAQHVPGPPPETTFPSGWQSDRDAVPPPQLSSRDQRDQSQQSSTNPFSPMVEQQRLRPEEVQSESNMRSLQEGSIAIEGRSFSGRSNASDRSHAEFPGAGEGRPAGVIGRPTPPSQPSSQQSHYSSHPPPQQQPPQLRQSASGGFHSEFQGSAPGSQYAGSTHSHNPSPPSHASSFSQPPALPPKQALESALPEQETSPPQPQQKREQRASFSYQQHLQRHLANASTSPRGLTGYGPPPVPGNRLPAPPKASSPLSFRGRMPPREDENVNYNSKVSPQEERKQSFGSPKGSGNSPQHRSPQYNGSPHGSNASGTGQQRANPYSPEHRPNIGNIAREIPMEEHQLPRHEMSEGHNYYMSSMMTPPTDDGPAPPPAPSCPPPDTPISESQARGPPGPPGGFLKSMHQGGKFGIPLYADKRNDSREEGEGGTPAGFLGRAHRSKKSDESKFSMLGHKKRVGSGSSLKMERPASAEGDDPIPEEYRPRASETEEHKSPRQGAAQQQGDRRPPLASAGMAGGPKAPEKTVSFKATPPSSQQRSPHEVGLGGYLYSSTKPIPPPSAGNSGTVNPRFPGGSIGSPLSATTSPPGSVGTRESVMRGQWVDETAATSGPAPIRGEPARKSEEFSSPPQPVPASTASASKYFAGFGPTPHVQVPLAEGGSYHASPEHGRHDEVPTALKSHDTVDEEATNPSESPTPDIPGFPFSNAHPASMYNGKSMLLQAFADLMPTLHPAHVHSLLNFAYYLAEDAIYAEQAERVKEQMNRPDDGEPSPSGRDLSIISEKRVNRWKEWSRLEDIERTRQAGIPMSNRQPRDESENPFESQDDRDAEEEHGHGGVSYEGMQPLPPPPRLPELDEIDTSNYHKHSRHGSLDMKHMHDYVPVTAPEPPRDHTPSPTPTIDQVAAAPKVDLELQMPRPMPSVPAIRIDPSARRRHEDDASTVASDPQSSRKGPGESMDMGHPGGTPYPFPFPKRQHVEYSEDRQIDTHKLNSIITAFTRAKSSAGGRGAEEELMAEIPPFLHKAYAALDQATNALPLDKYLAEARRNLETKVQNRLMQYNNDLTLRRQQHQIQTHNLYNTGRLTFADIEKMRGDFEQEEERRKMDFEKEVYLIFENDYIEIAYKEVKKQLEELGNRWYEDVKAWLFNVTQQKSRGTGTALEYHLLLEAIDLLNKLHVKMEEHEHALQSLVSDRNARYLQVSIAPLFAMGEGRSASEAEHRYWIDEQERQMRGKVDRAKRIAEHKICVDRIGEQLIDGLRKRFGEVLDAVWNVVWQFPPAVQPTLCRKFFDENTMPLPSSNESPGSYTVPQETVIVLADAVQTLGEIVGLIKLALDFQATPAVRVVEASIALSIAEDLAGTQGVAAPIATARLCAEGVKKRLPPALKRVGADSKELAENVVGGLVEVLERLRVGVAEVARGGGRVDIKSLPGMQQEWQNHPQQTQAWEQGSGESWVTAGYGLPQMQQQQPQARPQGQGQQGQQPHISQQPGPGGLSVSTLIGGFRRSGNTNSMLISPGGYSPTAGYSPAGMSAVSMGNGAPWTTAGEAMTGSPGSGHGFQ